jgi:hypothetical protein
MVNITANIIILRFIRIYRQHIAKRLFFLIQKDTEGFLCINGVYIFQRRQLDQEVNDGRLNNKIRRDIPAYNKSACLFVNIFKKPRLLLHLF